MHEFCVENLMNESKEEDRLEKRESNKKGVVEEEDRLEKIKNKEKVIKRVSLSLCEIEITD